MAVGKLSGAVGTYSATSPELERLMCERLGLEPEVLERLDRVAEIPLAGMPHSLNAATSAAIAVYEYCRQFPGPCSGPETAGPAS